MCLPENFEGKLWLFWKVYKFFHYQFIFATRQEPFHRVYQMCIVPDNGSIFRKIYFFSKVNVLFYHLRTFCEKFQVLSLDFFGRVAETASYVSMKTIWRKTFFKREVILLTQFCASSKVFCAWRHFRQCCEKDFLCKTFGFVSDFFASIVETAFYLSIWMSWGKMFFFWKKDFLDSVSGHFQPRPKFSAGLSKRLFTCLW